MINFSDGVNTSLKYHCYNSDKYDNRTIRIVIGQLNISVDETIKLLDKNNGDIVNSIMSYTNTSSDKYDDHTTCLHVIL